MASLRNRATIRLPRIAPDEVMHGTFAMLSEAKHLAPDQELSIATNGISHSLARSFAVAQDDKKWSQGVGNGAAETGKSQQQEQ